MLAGKKRVDGFSVELGLARGSIALLLLVWLFANAKLAEAPQPSAIAPPAASHTAAVG